MVKPEYVGGVFILGLLSDPLLWGGRLDLLLLIV